MIIVTSIFPSYGMAIAIVALIKIRYKVMSSLHTDLTNIAKIGYILFIFRYKMRISDL